MSTRRGPVLIIVCLLMAAGALLFKYGNGPTPAVAQTPPTVPVSDVCKDVPGNVPRWFAKETDGNKFGPAAPFDLGPARKAQHEVLCLDPANLVITQETIDGKFSSPANRAARTRVLVANPTARLAAVAYVQAELAKAKEVRLEVHTGPYQTFYMTTDGDVPEVFQSAGSFTEARHVLVYDFGNGRTVNFVLECNFQGEFPGPVKNVPVATPGTVPALVQPGPTSPPPTTCQSTNTCSTVTSPPPVCCGPPPTTCQVNCGPPPTTCQVNCGPPPTTCQVNCGPPPTTCQVNCGPPPTVCTHKCAGEDVAVSPSLDPVVSGLAAGNAAPTAVATPVVTAPPAPPPPVTTATPPVTALPSSDGVAAPPPVVAPPYVAPDAGTPSNPTTGTIPPPP